MKKIAALLTALIMLLPCAYAQQENESTITGIVIDAAMHTICIEAGDGERYTFHKEGDEDTSKLTRGIYIGGALTLTYTGNIDFSAHDASGARLTQISDGELPAVIELTTRVEGESDVRPHALWVSSAGYCAYYDAASFAVSVTDSGADMFCPADPDAISGVRLFGESLGDTSLDDALRRAAETLAFDVGEPLDTGALFDGYESRGEMFEADGMYYATYAVRASGQTYLFRAYYPLEAAEGYGTRLEAILRSVRFLNADGTRPCAVYLPTEQADGFTCVTVNAEYSPQGLMDALFEHGALPEPVVVISAAIDGDAMTLNLSRGYAQRVSSTGTAGERMLVGCVVNTMLLNFNVESISLLACSEIIETGHVIYDEPLRFMAD